MALITRCPACGTLFKVVPDQLRISDGWVRCGHCAEIFDAHQHMQMLAPGHAGGYGSGPRAPQAGGGRAAYPPAAPDAHPALGPEPVDTQPADIPTTPPASGPRLPPFTEAALRLGPTPAARPQRAAPVGVAPRAAPEPVRREPPGEALAAEVPDLDSLFAPVDVVSDAPAGPLGSGLGPAAEPGMAAAAMSSAPLDGMTGAVGDFQTDEGAAQTAAATTAAAEAPLQDVSFVRQARRRAFWRRPAVRALLALCLLILAALLLLQFAIHERDRIAAIRPDLEPWLNRLCEPLGCAVRPLRHIEALVIDGSTFGRLRENNYRLGITLRNRSPLEVAMPAVELTITDAQDQPLIRRVLLPEELGARRATLAGGAEWSAQAGLSIDAGAARVAGYRMLIFYP